MFTFRILSLLLQLQHGWFLTIVVDNEATSMRIQGRFIQHLTWHNISNKNEMIEIKPSLTEKPSSRLPFNEIMFVYDVNVGSGFVHNNYCVLFMFSNRNFKNGNV